MAARTINIAPDTSALGDAATLDVGTTAGTVMAGDDSRVTVDASGFNGNLTTSDDTLQEVAQKLDDLTIPAAGIQASTVDGKGELIVGSANDAVDNLAVGTDGHVLTLDSGQTLGVKWAAAAGGSDTSPVYGDASDGDVTISGATTLTKSMFYRNLTVNSGQTLNTDSFGIWVSGTLTVDGTISNSGSGTNGAPPNGVANRISNGGGTGGGAGAAGSGIAGGALRYGGTGGAGGNGSSTNGAAAGSSSAHEDTILRMGLWSFSTINAAAGARIGGGTGGGGGGAGSGGVGGAGGGGGGAVFIAARSVAGSGTVNATGANGVNASNTNSGGGGGGGGGFVVLMTGSASHSLTLSAAGGTGGTGDGTGLAGANGGIGKVIQILGGA